MGRDIEIEPLITTADHRIAYMRGSGDRLVVSLGGVGTRPDEMPPFEFVGTASDHGRNHVLLVSERARTWMNSPDLPEAIVKEIETVVSREKITDVVAIGNSMGGFMALVLPLLTRIDCVVALSPQVSMHPDIVPEETRWQRWRRQFQSYRFPRVPEPQDDTRYYIVHGDGPMERIHWARFPIDPKRYNHFILREQEHNLVKLLKSKELLRPLIERAMSRKPRQVRKLLEGHFDVIRREALPGDEIEATHYPRVTGTGERQ